MGNFRASFFNIFTLGEDQKIDTTGIVERAKTKHKRKRKLIIVYFSTFSTTAEVFNNTGKNTLWFQKKAIDLLKPLIAEQILCGKSGNAIFFNRKKSLLFSKKH